MSRLIDCFMFLNEIDILRGRLEYLYDKVDKFVIVDSNTTHMGVLKPDYLDCPDGHKLLQQYGDKIIRHHLVSDTSKLNYGPNLGWELDATQRAAIDDVICKFKPEDIIMIGDLDEIPSHAAIDMAIELITAKRFDAMVTLQDMFYYNFKQKQAHKCLATIICTNEYLAKGGGAQGARDRRNVMPTISEAGWHLSYFGDPESISNKIKNFAHQEFNSPEYTDVEKIRDRIAKGIGVFDSEEGNSFVPVDPRTISPEILKVVRHTPIAHYYGHIDGWFTSEDAECYKFLVAMTPKFGSIVEIGSFKGRSSSFLGVEILNQNKNIKMYCVDTFLGSPEHRVGGEFQDNDVVNGTLMDVFLYNMLPLEGLYKTISGQSVDAAAAFADNSLDAVFIDADHEYESTLADINAWRPKVKTGGIIAGHDIVWSSGVKNAVAECFPTFRVIGNCWYAYK